jgi:hypothetical protein
VCPSGARIASGVSAVSVGPGPPLETNTNVLVSGRKSIVVTLDVNGGVVAILRGSVRGRRLDVPIPPREVFPASGPPS